ncbi:MAG TPA: hypothetical protein VI356_11865 [Myxococcales bacterium]
MNAVARVAAFAAVVFLAAAISPANAAPWTFTKAEPVSQARPIASPAQGFDALVFAAQYTGTDGSKLTRMAFRIYGAMKVGNLSNFQLLYFPDGIGKPGIVLGKNDGATWAPGADGTMIEIAFAQPLAVSANFNGQFALRADLNGAPAFFTPDLRTVTVASSGGEQLVTQTEDLPLRGDTFKVN